MSLSQWADVAVVFLSIQAFVLMLVPLVLFYFLIRGMNIAGGAMPRYMKQAQSFTRIVRDRTQEASNKIAAPILKTRVKGVRMETTIRSFSAEVGETIYGQGHGVQTGGDEVRTTDRDVN